MSATFPLARANQGLDGFLAEGNILMQVKDVAGVYGPLEGPINGTTLSFNPGEGETKERISKMIGTSGQALNSIITAGTPSITFGFNDLGARQFALASRGAISAINEAGGSVSAASFTVPAAAKGGWIELPNRNIAVAGFSITGAGGTPTYTFSANADQDYGPINYEQGHVYIPKASTIANGATIEVTYTYLAVTGELIKGNQIDQTVMRLIFEGKNKANFQKMRIIFHEATVQPTQDIDVLGDDFAGAAFSGNLTTPVGKDAPYEVEWNLTLATA